MLVGLVLVCCCRGGYAMIGFDGGAAVCGWLARVVVWVFA